MDMVDGTIDWIKDKVDQIGAGFESVSDEWTAKVQELKAKAHDFVVIRERLETKVKTLPPESEVRKKAEAALAESQKVADFIQWLTTKIDGANTLLPTQNMNAWFLAPVPIIAVTSAITMLGATILKLRSSEKMVDKVIAAGGDPNKVLGAGKEPWLNIDLGNPALIFALIAVGYIMWPTIKQKLLK